MLTPKHLFLSLNIPYPSNPTESFVSMLFCLKDTEKKQQEVKL